MDREPGHLPRLMDAESRIARAGLRRMQRVLAVLALALAVVGLAASAASLYVYVAASPTFCVEAGCATVRASAWSHPLGVPMPLIGLGYFVAMVVLAFVDAPRLRLALAIAGAGAGVGLVLVQAIAIGAWCKLCLIADPAAIGLGAAVIAGARKLRPTPRVVVPATAALPAIGIALVAWAGAAAEPPPPPDVPAWVAREQAPGVATVVELVDFECPYCRVLDPELRAAVAAARSPVRVVRKMMPLRAHRHALDAALAWCCADAQGKGDAMAEALFAAEPDELTPDGCERLAARVGCDVARYRAQLADPATRARVDADLAAARAAGVHSLPTVFVGTTRLTGANHDRDELAAALHAAARSRE
jgi:predicted DsbA family dithiol-disulfide isomerase/uncharacterized membrane protein